MGQMPYETDGTNGQELEEHHRFQGRAAIVSTIKMRHLLSDELEIHRRVDLAQQVPLGTSISMVTISISNSCWAAVGFLSVTD
ncbi:hypothetical protein J2S30_002347 [Herbaspirillum rubrisubalbicans]|jgi:hypothetical protein|nr:hypothetical protein [Herbaspirillum rubrisubalbicans]